MAIESVNRRARMGGIVHGATAHVLAVLASVALGCGDPSREPSATAQLAPPTRVEVPSHEVASAEPSGTLPRDDESARAAAADEAAEVRIAALNVRWFPDGDAHGPGDHATDLDALAAALADLDADVIGLEELLRHERAVAALDTVRARLDTLTHGRWELVVDDCPDDEGRQHVGLLYDASRVERLAVHRVDALAGNERGDGCAGYMRPGLGVALRFASGFDAWVVVVHLDSGTDDRAFERRARSYAAFEGLTSELARTHGDRDVVVLGDFNTMGNDRGVSGLDEVGLLEHVLDAAGFRRLWLEPGCTEVSGGHVSMLDHIVVSASTDELAPSARAAAGGPCGRSRCRLRRDDPWLAHVSDHCPVSATFDGRDLD